jgi:phage portal protein, HK97 family
MVVAQNIGQIITEAIINRLPRTAGTFQGRHVDIFVNNAEGTDGSNPANATLAALYRYQPYVRAAVDWYARHVAQMAIHTFVRDGEHRERNTDNLAHELLSGQPNPWMTGFELIYDLVANLTLYNRAHWFFLPGNDGTPEIHPFPTAWVTPVWDTWESISHYKVQPPGKSSAVEIPAARCVTFTGWSPTPGNSWSVIDTLRMVLEENYHSHRYRIQLWRRSGRAGTYISRPTSAPEWDNNARRRFYAMFEDFTGDHGARAGSTPLLEDGMEIKSTTFKSADEQWAESITLSLHTVAQVFQIPAGLLGATDGLSYSSMREMNRAIFSNTLGPLVRSIEDRLNTFVLPQLGIDRKKYFVEFNVQEMLRGSIEDQANIFSTSTGGPWMTRNEARRINNLPPVPGGDELITPLNVIVGGQTSPQDGGSAYQGGGGKAAELIRDNLERAERIHQARGKTPISRLEKELADDLKKHSAAPDPAGTARNIYQQVEARGAPPYTDIQEETNDNPL